MERKQNTDHASILFVTYNGSGTYYRDTRAGIPATLAGISTSIIVDPEYRFADDSKPSEHEDTNATRCVRISNAVIYWRNAKSIESLAKKTKATIERLIVERQCNVRLVLLVSSCPTTDRSFRQRL